jgi:hypothetical protein
MLITFSEFKITVTSPILLTVLRIRCAPWIRRRRTKQELELLNLLNFMKGNFSRECNKILFRIYFFSECYHYGVPGSDVIQSGGLVQSVDVSVVPFERGRLRRLVSLKYLHFVDRASCNDSW